MVQSWNKGTIIDKVARIIICKLYHYKKVLLLCWFEHFLDSRAELCQIFRWFCGKSMTSKRHSEINWPLKEALLGAEPVRAELDRGTKVLLPNQAQKPISLPPDFFNVTQEELKREQELKYVCPFIMSTLV